MRIRQWALLGAAAGACAWAPLARAQDAEETEATESDEEETSRSEVEGVDVVDTPRGDRVRIPKGASGKEEVPGEVHTVVRGDTLWDLSQTYLGTPWYWPKVWSYNPEIANPHWIYPGNKVKFYSGAGDDGPSRVEVGTGPEDEELEGGGNPDAVSRDDSGTVQVVGKIGYTPKPAQRVMTEGFITPKEVDEAGEIRGSFSEGEMLAFPDNIYIGFRKKSSAKVGDRYLIFRSLGRVKHPIKGGIHGYLTKVLGIARVVSLNDKLVTAQIEKSFDEINRGDLIGPYGENLMQDIQAKRNEKRLQGYVLTPLTPHLTTLGEHHVVVIDRGRNDGVQTGNTFTVVRQGDGGGDFLNPAKGQDKRFPLEDVAICTVLEAKEKASTCLLTRSIREVVAGDRVEMRTGPAAAAPTASLR